MRLARAAIAAAWLACAAASPAHAQHDEQPSPGAWPAKVYRWQYNGTGHPAWLSGDQSRQLVIDASREWEACGLKMEYAGETDHMPGVRDGVNVIGWRRDMPHPGMRGLTQGRSARGRLLERDITFASARPEFARYPTLLRKVIVHEFGHAIGLTHSASCNDVMTLASDCARANPLTLPQTPTPHDLERCRALYADTRPNTP